MQPGKNQRRGNGHAPRGAREGHAVRLISASIRVIRGQGFGFDNPPRAAFVGHPLGPMHVLWFEFLLALRRLGRRRAQNGLLLVTFTVSVALSLLSWTLFHTVHLSRPDFDPRGEYYVLTCAGSLAVDGTHASPLEIEAYKAGHGAFADFAEVALYASIIIQTPIGAERFHGAYLSSRALQITGTRPLTGRLFTPDDDRPGTAPMILLSERLWENNFARDPDIAGKTVDIGGELATIAGVLPARYRFPNDQDLWLSYGAVPDHPRYSICQALVKLKPGVSRGQAEQELQLILARLGPESPTNKMGRRPVLQPLRQEFLLPEIRTSAVILLCLSLVFVLVSCANAANLMLIDFLGRRPEIAALLALGVPRAAVIRLVCFQVAVIGAGAAAFSLAVLPAIGPLLYERIKVLNAPYWLSYRFEWHFAAMALGLVAVAVAVTLIAPIAYLLWVDPDTVIREQASAGRGTGRAWWRRLMLTGQIALLTVLGVCAGLLVRTSYHVGESRWGYPAGRVFMGKLVNYYIDSSSPGAWVRRLALHRRALDEVTARPETAAAAFVDNPPGYSNGPFCRYALDPAAFAGRAERGEAFYSRVTEGYFNTLDVPFLAGKMFPRENADNGPIYAVINHALAAKLWPGQDPLQRVLYVRYSWLKETDPPVPLVIHGVVRDFQANGPTAKTNDGIFTPFMPRNGAPGGVFLCVRDRAGVPQTQSLAEAVHRTDPRMSLYFPSTIAGQINLMLSSVRMTTDLTTVFAAAAVVLCAIGVYSLTLAQVLQSAREFGIRLALGAEPLSLWRHFARGHLLVTLIGVVIGLVLTTQVVRVLRALLHGVQPYDAGIYAGVSGVILAVSALACVPSLFRLKRINPAECLRSL